MTAAVDARAWGWLAHLRDGGTTPWARWQEAGEAAGRLLPSAQQLELVRRLNATGTPSAALVSRVLRDSPPGRGQPDLELAGAVPERAFGPRPVDPATLRSRELLRVAAAVIAEDLVAAGPRPRPRPGRRRPWRRRYRLVGDPSLTGGLGAQLRTRGRPPGGRDPVVLVLAAPLDRMLADAWAARCFGLGPRPWGAWLERHLRDADLPREADPLHLARRWADRVGRDRVEIVLDHAAVAHRLGVRGPLEVPDELPAVVPDLARRVSSMLGLHVPDRRRVVLLRRGLRPRLGGVTGPPLVLPPEHLDWVRDGATRVADGLRRDGYAVHGDLDDLAPGRRTGVVAPDPAVTLDVALALMLEEDRS